MMLQVDDLHAANCPAYVLLWGAAAKPAVNRISKGLSVMVLINRGRLEFWRERLNQTQSHQVHGTGDDEHG